MLTEQPKISLKFASVSLAEKGFVVIRIHEGAEIDVAEIKAINAAKDELAGDAPYVVMFIAPNIGNISSQARGFSASKEVYRNAICKAIVTKSLASRIIGNFFIRFNRPPAPTRVFGSETEAEKWLRDRL